MKLPYGISDFARLRRDGYFYQDRTSYIPLLESLGEPYLFFLRPRRFGKSLWLSVLAHYYGREHAEDFEWLFKGLAVGEQPTPLANRYLVLKFDFSRIDTSSRADTKQGFTRNVIGGIRQFLLRYQASLPDLDPGEILTEADASTCIQNLFTALTGTKHRIYLLIDKYDHFTNQLIGPDLRHFQEIVTGTGYVRKFYESIKTAMGQGMVERIFMTGVSPVTLDSLTSGFNIGANFSRDALLADMMGFTPPEVEAMLSMIGVAAEAVPTVMQDLRDWYNGYRFATKATETLYNPDMVLYFLSAYERHQAYPEDMLDTNIASDYGRIRQLFRLGGKEARHFELLQHLLETREIRTQITAQFSFEKTFTDVDFLSLLYYTGLLTIKGQDLGEAILGMPNKVIEKLYYQYFADLRGEQLTETTSPLDLGKAERSSATIGQDTSPSGSIQGSRVVHQKTVQANPEVPMINSQLNQIHFFVQQMDAEQKRIEESKARINQHGTRLLDELIPYLKNWEPIADEKAVHLYPVEKFAFYVWYEYRRKDRHVFRERPTYEGMGFARNQIFQAINPEPGNETLIIPLSLYEVLSRTIGLDSWLMS